MWNSIITQHKNETFSLKFLTKSILNEIADAEYISMRCMIFQ